MCWMFVCACGAEPAEAAAAARTSGAESAPAPAPLPAAFEGTLTQTIHIPVALLESALQTQLPDHETVPRSLLTRPNASPGIEAEVEVWRDAVSVHADGDSLLVEVALRYAAKFSARIKNPFGGKWLTVAENADWGTADEPQHMTLRVHTQVEITPQWQLHLRTAVDPPEHGAPPNGQLCTGGMFKLCITEDSFAPEVRRRLDAELVPRVQSKLDEVDRQIQQKIDLRARAERVWNELTQPRALPAPDQFSVIEPQRAALELHGAGDEIVIEPAIYGKVSYYRGRPNAAPAVAPSLPDKSALADLPGERREEPGLLALGL
jgi:Domain of unknown function (DUF4403)